jgi:hypothetical protein
MQLSTVRRGVSLRIILYPQRTAERRFVFIYNAKIGNKKIFQMEENKNNSQIETAAEIEAEKEHLSEVKEDDIRSQIISEYGFDEESDKERIDKLVSKEVDYKKSLSKTIAQKIKYRDEFKKLKPQVDTDKSKDTSVDFDKKLAEALEKRDLESLEYPDELKKVISQIAKVNETSVKKATEDPYVKAKIDAWQKQKDAEETALGRNNKSSSKERFDPETPPDVDMTTKEGVAAYDTWKAKAIKYEMENRG